MNPNDRCTQSVASGCMSALTPHQSRERGPTLKDNYVSKAVVISYLFWGKTALVVALVWALAIIEAPPDFVVATALLGIVSLIVAAVWQIRLYMLRLCGLIRVSSGLETPDAELHRIGPRCD